MDLQSLRDELRRVAMGPWDKLPDDVSIEIAQVSGADVVLVIAEIPPWAPAHEPTVDITFGGVIVMRVGLTFLHHLNNQGGWRGGRQGDRIMSLVFHELERGMWKSLEPRRIHDGASALAARKAGG